MADYESLLEGEKSAVLQGMTEFEMGIASQFQEFHHSLQTKIWLVCSIVGDPLIVFNFVHLICIVLNLNVLHHLPNE